MTSRRGRRRKHWSEVRCAMSRRLSWLAQAFTQPSGLIVLVSTSLGAVIRRPIWAFPPGVAVFAGWRTVVPTLARRGLVGTV